MTKIEQRVIESFTNVVRSGEYTFDHAWILMNDRERYGYLTDEAKGLFYSEFKNGETEAGV
jgi:hypothetical protein